MKTVAIGFIYLDALMESQSDAINSSLASNSGHRESVNSIKVDHRKAKNSLNALLVNTAVLQSLEYQTRFT